MVAEEGDSKYIVYIYIVYIYIVYSIYCSIYIVYTVRLVIEKKSIQHYAYRERKFV